MKSIIYAIIVLNLFVGACSTNKLEAVEVELVKVDSLVLKPDTTNLFGTLDENFKINSSGEKLAFYDRIKEKVFVFDRQGNFFQSFGEYNKGPKGIISVDGYDFTTNGEIVIMDLRQSLLKIFDPKGVLGVKSTSIFEDESLFLSGTDFLIYNDTIYVPIINGEYATTPDSSNLIGKLDLNGNVIETFGTFDPFFKDDNQYLLTNMFNISSNGIIYTNLASSFRINYYDLKNQSYLGTFGTRFPSFSLPNKNVKLRLSIPEINKRMTGTTVTNSIHNTNDYFIQSVQTLTKEWFDNVNYEDKDNFLVLYDLESKSFLGEIHTDHTLGAVHNNQLYMIESFDPDNYTIGIYELAEKK